MLLISGEILIGHVSFISQVYQVLIIIITSRLRQCRAIKLDFGAQYTFDINKKHSVTIGAIYSPKLKLGNDYSVTTQMVSNSTGTAVSTTTLKPDATFEVPNTFAPDLHITMTNA